MLEIPNQVNTALNRLAPWLLLAVIIWLCWTLAAIIWLVIAPPQPPNLPPIELSQNQSTTSDSGQYAIFAVPEPRQSVPSNQPPPNVELQGVMLSTTPQLSSAILTIDGQTRTYRIGKALENTGYTLVDVAWNQATIESSSGDRSVVELASPQLDSLDQPANATKAPRPRPTRSPIQRAPNTFRPPKPSAEEQLKSAVDDAVQGLKTNPAGYLSRMGVMATGDGYQVTNAMPEKIRKNMGLKSGDKVISVNGQSVGQPQSDAGLLEQIMQSGSAEIQVQRGEQVVTIRQKF